MKKLPIGIQDFRSLIEGDYAYVDKTESIYHLINTYGACFFSRPRRFGKSLLASTIASLFRGERELFDGTWIADSDYAWPEHPVIYLDFSALATSTPEVLLESLNRYLLDVANGLEVTLSPRPHPSENMSALVAALSNRGQPVILIDEYDRPLVKHIAGGDRMAANREVLQDFFAMLKTLQGQLRFVFLTGVSRFSKVSLFSGLNSLADVSLVDSYATLVGLTEREIQDNFAEQLQAVANRRGGTLKGVIERMRSWYNGYRFARSGASDRVYTPWSVLNYLQSGELKNYWFASATPTFAIKLLKERNFPLDTFETGVEAGEEIEDNHQTETIGLISLLFQTGYLTIDHFDESTHTYLLRPPNEEVKRSLVDHLFRAYVEPEQWEVKPFLRSLREALEGGEFDEFFNQFNDLLAGVPYNIHEPTESYYHSLLYLCVRMLGFDVQAEVMTSRGRVDMVVEASTAVYLFEFKIDSSAKKAIKQIRESDYPSRYRVEGKPLVLIGANFSTKNRRIADWQSGS